MEHAWALRTAASDMLQDCDALESEEKVVAKGGIQPPTRGFSVVKFNNLP
jgi:hypothetical protein